MDGWMMDDGALLMVACLPLVVVSMMLIICWRSLRCVARCVGSVNYFSQ
jgi:hypothetical protein